MTTVFIGGSRKISRLNEVIRPRLDNIVQGHLAVAIGDANGADKTVQTYLAQLRYQHVTVYCAGPTYRNNVGRWPTVHVPVERTTRDFEYYAQKDARMAQAGSCGFMLWDGSSKGTLNNILGLLRAEKKCLVYFGPERECRLLRTLGDLSELIRKCSQADQMTFEKKFHLSQIFASSSSGLFSHGRGAPPNKEDSAATLEISVGLIPGRQLP
jgi:hypothetical protein